MVSIQGGAALAKRLFPVVGAEGAIAYRVSFAALILLILWRPWRQLPRGRQWLDIWRYGVSLGVMNLLFYMAIARIPLGIAVALEFTGPLAVALWASRGPRDYMWAALAVVGLALLLPIAPGAALDPAGVGLALGAGTCWALYIVFGKRAGGSPLNGGVVTSLGMLCAAVAATPFGIYHAGRTLLDPALLPVGLAVGLFSSALPYSLEMIALKELPTQTFGILMSTGPAVAALSGLVFLGERLAWVQVLAIALVIAASVGSNVSSADALEAT